MAAAMASNGDGDEYRGGGMAGEGASVVSGLGDGSVAADAPPSMPGSGTESLGASGVDMGGGGGGESTFCGGSSAGGGASVLSGGIEPGSNMSMKSVRWTCPYNRQELMVRTSVQRCTKFGGASVANFQWRWYRVHIRTSHGLI